MTTTPSELEAANARLLALRAALASDKKPSAPPVPTTTPLAQGDDIARLCAALPAHLGWGSEAVTAQLRRHQGEAVAAVENREEPLVAPAIQPIAPPPAPVIASIKLYPDIGLALLRTERVADGRLWLLLRALDENGRGVWTRQAAYDALTCDDAPHRLCSERHLRKLLERGEGLFWHQDGQKRIWLHSQAKVAAALEIGRLRLKPIALPLAILCQPIGDVRAHFYASFHSIRSSGDKAALPISRQRLTALSGACPRTQQTYDARAAVKVETCIAVGREVTAVNSHEEAWQNGRASFSLKDHLGKRGERGKVYHARRLPNSYSGPHAASGHGCRRLNRQLTDLRQKGAGNGQGTQSEKQTWTQLYAADGAAGAKVWSKAGGRRPIYWRGRDGRGVLIWHTLPAVAD